MLLICITVFLSYLPEAGQYSSFFLYLRQVSLAREVKLWVQEILAYKYNQSCVTCPKVAFLGQ